MLGISFAGMQDKGIGCSQIIIITILTTLVTLLVTDFSLKSTVVALIFLAVLICIVFIWPMSEQQIIKKAGKNRLANIRKYYSLYKYYYGDANVDRFAKEMDPNGAFYTLIDMDVSVFPAYVSYLLKYKKHQWSIIGFERNKRVRIFWENKGSSRDETHSKLSLIGIVEQIKDTQAQTVFFFRNYPNPDFYCYDTAPFFSEVQGCISALGEPTINFVAIECIKGHVGNILYEKYSDLFYPLVNYIVSISKRQGRKEFKDMNINGDLRNRINAALKEI